MNDIKNIIFCVILLILSVLTGGLTFYIYLILKSVD